MSKIENVFDSVIRGRSDTNIRFGDLIKLLESLGFVERIRGSHHIFTHPDVEEIINIQPKGSMGKPYQVKQIRNIILKYKLGVDDE